MPECADHALHDRKAEAEAGGRRGMHLGCHGVAAMKLEKDVVEFFTRYATTGIGDPDAYAVTATAGRDEDATAVGVANRIGDDVLQDAAQHRRV